MDSLILYLGMERCYLFNFSTQCEGIPYLGQLNLFGW